MQKNNLYSIRFAILVSIAPISALSGATPLVEYLFNGSGNTAVNSGTLANQDLTFYNADGVASNLYGSAGSGVSGAAGDLAFDNSASTGMGSSGIGGRAVSGTRNWGSLDSFTLMGWYNTNATTGAGATLISTYNSSNSTGVRLIFNASGSIALTVNDKTTSNFGGGSYVSGGEWVFFAVTYDSTAGATKAYIGTTGTAVSETGSTLLSSGSVNMDANFLSIGNLNYNGRPFDGLIDDIRIFGSNSGGQGALTLTEIEAYRVSSIPEPAEATAALGIALTLLALSYRRLSAKAS